MTEADPAGLNNPEYLSLLLQDLLETVQGCTNDHIAVTVNFEN